MIRDCTFFLRKYFFKVSGTRLIHHKWSQWGRSEDNTTVELVMVVVIEAIIAVVVR